MTKSQILQVPYYIQPTSNTCQSTVLKMYAVYLANSYRMSSIGANKSIRAIQRELKTAKGRPVKDKKKGYLYHVNLMWWMEKYFWFLNFSKLTTTNKKKAIKKIDSFFRP